MCWVNIQRKFLLLRLLNDPCPEGADHELAVARRGKLRSVNYVSCKTQKGGTYSE